MPVPVSATCAPHVTFHTVPRAAHHATTEHSFHSCYYLRTDMVSAGLPGSIFDYVSPWFYLNLPTYTHCHQFCHFVYKHVLDAIYHLPTCVSVTCWIPPPHLDPPFALPAFLFYLLIWFRLYTCLPFDCCFRFVLCAVLCPAYCFVLRILFTFCDVPFCIAIFVPAFLFCRPHTFLHMHFSFYFRHIPLCIFVFLILMGDGVFSSIFRHDSSNLLLSLSSPVFSL